MARQYKDPPILAHQTGKTCSRHSARQTGTSNSSTINQSTEGDLSSPDGSTFDPPILIDRAAFNQGVNAKYPPPHRNDRDLRHPHGTRATRYCLSNGEDVIGPLCARDYKGVGSEYVNEGKVICTRIV